MASKTVFYFVCYAREHGSTKRRRGRCICSRSGSQVNDTSPRRFVSLLLLGMAWKFPTKVTPTFIFISREQEVGERTSPVSPGYSFIILRTSSLVHRRPLCFNLWATPENTATKRRRVCCMSSPSESQVKATFTSRFVYVLVFGGAC